MRIKWQTRRVRGLWLCAALWLACPVFAQTPDPCETFLKRGLSCTHTPNQVGEWKYSASYGQWTSQLPRDFPSATALLDAWMQATRSALSSPTQRCDAGNIVNLMALLEVPGSFERNTFPERLQNGEHQYTLRCTDTSLGYPIQRTEVAVISVQAERVVGCAPPQTAQTWPGTGFSMCVGASRPVVTLKDLGPEQLGSRASPRIIEATMVNSANNNAPMGDATVELRVLPPTGQRAAGRLLNTTYPGQYTPATTTLGITDRQGKTLSTFYWPQTALQAPIQRVGAQCGVSGHCETTLDLPWNKDIVIGFFNGVANTDQASQKSLYRLETEFGPTFKNAPLKYDWFYNQTACGDAWYGKLACLEDVAEVFEQRSHELGGVFVNRWETFWDVLAGRHTQDMTITGRLVNLLSNGGNALLQWLDATANALINQLARDTLKLITLFTDSPSYENRTAHLERLIRHADEGARLLLVAHSQGNLFVNSAHDALKAIKPDAPTQVVHVAPASPTLRGAYVLADIDLVINGLRASGLNSVPDVNIALPRSRQDVTGHGFEPTYLDKTRAAYNLVRSMITTSLEAFEP